MSEVVLRSIDKRAHAPRREGAKELGVQREKEGERGERKELVDRGRGRRQGQGEEGRRGGSRGAYGEKGD